MEDEVKRADLGRSGRALYPGRWASGGSGENNAGFPDQDLRSLHPYAGRLFARPRPGSGLRARRAGHLPGAGCFA